MVQSLDIEEMIVTLGVIVSIGGVREDTGFEYIRAAKLKYGAAPIAEHMNNSLSKVRNKMIELSEEKVEEYISEDKIIKLLTFLSILTHEGYLYGRYCDEIMLYCITRFSGNKGLGIINTVIQIVCAMIVEGTVKSKFISVERAKERLNEAKWGAQ